MADAFVLDSFALMALFQGESGADRVEKILEQRDAGEVGVFMSIVNLGEVIYTMQIRYGLKAAQESLSAVDQSPIDVVLADRPLTLAAARLKASTGLGYADCFAAALAQQLDATIVTGDPDFQRVEDLIAIEWLPPAQSS